MQVLIGMDINAIKFAYINTENKGHANRSMQYPANWKNINLQSTKSHSTVKTQNFFGFQIKQMFSVHLEKNGPSCIE